MALFKKKEVESIPAKVIETNKNETEKNEEPKVRILEVESYNVLLSIEAQLERTNALLEELIKKANGP
jgi:hypothetical protein